MSIAHQTATPAIVRRSGLPSSTELAPVPRPRRALAKIAALVAATAFGAALVAGLVGLALVMVMSTLGG